MSWISIRCTTPPSSEALAKQNNSLACHELRRFAAKKPESADASADRPDSFPVTDPDLDAPDGAVVDGYERVRMTWKRRDKLCPSCGCLLAVYLGELEEHRSDCPRFPL